MIELQKAQVPPESERCQRVVKAYWELIMEFTNGDVNLLPKLMEIGTIDVATNNWEARQKKINDYLEPALKIYFSTLEKDPLSGVKK